MRWIESKLTPVLNNKEEVVRIDGISSDITDRKIAKANLINSEKKYRRIVETSQEGILTFDEHNRINFVNQKLCEILGYAENELNRMEVVHIVADEDKPNSVAALKRRKQGVRETFELKMLSKSGLPVWANICASPVFDDNGDYIGGLAMITDITEKKKQELLRLQFEANLQTIFNNTDSSYVLMDTSLKIVSFNRVAQTVINGLLGLQLAEGRCILDFCFPDRVAFVRDVIAEAMAGEPVVYDAYYTHLDSTVRWYEIKWLCVRDQGGESVGLILSGVDITDRMAILQEQQKTTADLISRNKDLQQFTYMVSHNLRAPVANIMALVTLLKDEEIDQSDNKELVDGIGLCAQKLDAIINDMNHILQVRQQVNEKKETVYFNHLAEGAINALRARLTKEKAEVRYNFEGAGHIFSVRSYIYSIFYTLILNGVKYRRANIAPVINITAVMRENNIDISFEDNGTGIDLEKHGKHLFTLYKHFDLNVEGRGTGLFMVKSQVEQLGGTISVKSELNKGSIFTVTMPL
jgi:PAS domain S-box-containing protein